MSTPLPNVPDTAQIAAGNDEINTTRARLAEVETLAKSLKTRIDATGYLGNLPRFAAEPTGNPSTVPVRWGNARMSSLEPVNPLEVATKSYTDRTFARVQEQLIEVLQKVAELEERVQGND